MDSDWLDEFGLQAEEMARGGLLGVGSSEVRRCVAVRLADAFLAGAEALRDMAMSGACSHCGKGVPFVEGDSSRHALPSGIHATCAGYSIAGAFHVLREEIK
jgi:hypothetical protein